MFNIIKFLKYIDAENGIGFVTGHNAPVVWSA